ncbi:MAG: hypothetical protein WC464_03105 [Bdellovibrionales bacterium]
MLIVTFSTLNDIGDYELGTLAVNVDKIHTIDDVRILESGKFQGSTLGRVNFSYGSPKTVVLSCLPENEEEIDFNNRLKEIGFADFETPTGRILVNLNAVTSCRPLDGQSSCMSKQTLLVFKNRKTRLVSSSPEMTRDLIDNHNNNQSLDPQKQSSCTIETSKTKPLSTAFSLPVPQKSVASNQDDIPMPPDRYKVLSRTERNNFIFRGILPA